ncbi:MAG: hypothetical protein K2N34_01300, partial [Lachnospiraceae bacterium]|nr:hypothetical protein [Lachnospiraceae bacterium]
KKIDKFIIYPFGSNGVGIRNILKDYFNLAPCFIVDNEYSKYNSGIINKNMLRDVWQEDMYIIVTVENVGVNAQIVEELSEFVPSNNIINLRNQKCKKQESDIKGFRLYEFLPLHKSETNAKASNKIKVRVMHSEAMCWNTISTICQAFKDDLLFDVLLVISAVIDREEVAGQAQEKGYNYILLDEYYVESDMPDILVLHNAYNPGETARGNYREFTKLIVVASFQLVIYDNTIEEFLLTQDRVFGRCRPDYFLFDSFLYQKIAQLDYFSGNIVEMGNAKFDGIYLATQAKKYANDYWKKLEGKRTVLWAPSHGIVSRNRGGYEVQKYLTFDLYAKTFFDYANQNQEMGFIFRPHNTFINEMLEFRFWSPQDLELFKQYCKNSANIVYDDADTYDISFSIADGILTDAFCGVTCSALPTLKPICACYRSKEKEDAPYCEELLKNLYSAYDSKDITAFLDMVKNNHDPMLELRKKASEKYVKHFDGKNGWRIKEFIKSKYLELESCGYSYEKDFK